MKHNWQEIIKTSPRSYHFLCRNLATGKVIQHQADQLVEAASTIKVAILLCLLQKVQAGELSLEQEVRVLERHLGRNGSGALQHFDHSRPLVLYNLALLMIIVSDNVATNVLVDLLGKDTINAYIKDLGLTQTALVMERLDFADEYSQTDQKVGVTTAREMAELIARLVSGQLLNEEFTGKAMQILYATQRDIFCRRLPFGKLKKWGNKTGSLTYADTPIVWCNDCGYIIDTSDKTYIFAMFMNGPADQAFAHSPDSDAKIEFAEVAASLFAELRQG